MVKAKKEDIPVQKREKECLQTKPEPPITSVALSKTRWWSVVYKTKGRRGKACGTD